MLRIEVHEKTVGVHAHFGIMGKVVITQDVYLRVYSLQVSQVFY